MAEYVASFNGEEYFFQVNPSAHSAHRATDLKHECERIISKKGMVTSRSNPVPVSVKVERLEAVNGKLNRIKVGAYSVVPPLSRMTAEEYQAEMEKVLKDLPPEFQGYVSSEAYDRGHSAGYEEVVSIATGMTYALQNPIREFQKRITKA